MSVRYQRLETLRRIGVHHSATDRDTTTVQAIGRGHAKRGIYVNRREGILCGYNAVVLANGRLIVTRPRNVVPAAQKGANWRALAICLVGDNTRQNQRWLARQIKTARQWIASVQQQQAQFGRGPLPIQGHRDLGTTATLCPADDLARLRA